MVKSGVAPVVHGGVPVTVGRATVTSRCLAGIENNAKNSNRREPWRYRGEPGRHQDKMVSLFVPIRRNIEPIPYL